MRVLARVGLRADKRASFRESGPKILIERCHFSCSIVLRSSRRGMMTKLWLAAASADHVPGIESALDVRGKQLAMSTIAASLTRDTLRYFSNHTYGLSIRHPCRSRRNMPPNAPACPTRPTTQRRALSAVSRFSVEQRRIPICAFTGNTWGLPISTRRMAPVRLLHQLTCSRDEHERSFPQCADSRHFVSPVGRAPRTLPCRLSGQGAVALHKITAYRFLNPRPVLDESHCTKAIKFS